MAKTPTICRFQSTLPYGSDRPGRLDLADSDNFNPRSLTGATWRSLDNTCNHWYFNPRSLTGATFFGQHLFQGGGKFQSTLPYGSDLLRRFDYSIYGHFNPRSLTGATTPTITDYINSGNFNPRSLTGATVYVHHHK